jgi:hypothetical protein
LVILREECRLRVLRKILALKREEVTGENCGMRNFMICTAH